jgi:protein TonB
MKLVRPFLLLSLVMWPLTACEQPPVDTTIDAPAAATGIDAGANGSDAEAPPEFDDPEPAETASPPPEDSAVPVRADNRRSARESPEQRRQSSGAAQESRGGEAGTEVEKRTPERTGPSVVTNPDWGRQVLPEYPERAAARGFDQIATVRLSCALQPNGSLTDCQTVLEDPPGMGFGSAALAAARRSRVTPGTVDGSAVGARVEWTIRFRPPPPE